MENNRPDFSETPKFTVSTNHIEVSPQESTIPICQYSMQLRNLNEVNQILNRFFETILSWAATGKIDSIYIDFTFKSQFSLTTLKQDISNLDINTESLKKDW